MGRDGREGIKDFHRGRWLTGRRKVWPFSASRLFDRLQGEARLEGAKPLATRDEVERVYSICTREPEIFNATWRLDKFFSNYLTNHRNNRPLKTRSTLESSENPVFASYESSN